MNLILLAGLWLPRSIWCGVCAELERLQHRPIAVELPGVDDDSPAATLNDQLDAVLAAIDGCSGPVVLVGHSAASTLAWMAADRRAARIQTVVFIGGFPATDQTRYAEFFPIVDGMMAFPGWSAFEGPDSDDLDATARAQISADAISVPEGVASGIVRYENEHRFDVPVVVVCPEFTPEQAQIWIDSGDVVELAKAKKVTLEDIASGHWPMVTRPAELAQLLDQIARKAIG